jgi:large subunit ribosomal protein L4
MTVKLNVYNLEGKQEADALNANEEIFAGKVNKGLLHLAVLWYLANSRAGSANTKTKSEVRGGGRKPYRQKGTGNARRGSSRSPLMVGGGVSFGPKPRSFAFKFTKKMKKAALRSALSNKGENLIVIKDFKIKAPKTKEMNKILNNFDLQDNALFVDVNLAEDFERAGRNISKIKSINVDKINVYDLMKYSKLFITKDAVKKLEEKLA